MVGNRKLICYYAKSLKLVYLLILGVFLYEAWIVTDFRAVEADQQQLASHSGFIHNAACLSAYPGPVSAEDGHARITERASLQ